MHFVFGMCYTVVTHKYTLTAIDNNCADRNNTRKQKAR